MHGDGWGKVPSIKSGYFFVRVINAGFREITITQVGLKSYPSKCCFNKRYNGFMLFEPTKVDTLPKVLKHNEEYVYFRPLQEMQEQLQNLKSQERAYNKDCVTDDLSFRLFYSSNSLIN